MGHDCDTEQDEQRTPHSQRGGFLPAVHAGAHIADLVRVSALPPGFRRRSQLRHQLRRAPKDKSNCYKL
jgi:hypothetical protein